MSSKLVPIETTIVKADGSTFISIRWNRAPGGAAGDAKYYVAVPSVVPSASINFEEVYWRSVDKAYEDLIDTGDVPNSDYWKDPNWVERWADKNDVDLDVAISVANRLIENSDNERLRADNRHSERVAKIVAETPEVIKRGSTVVVKDGDAGRIVKIAHLRGGKFSGPTNDQFADTYYEDFPVDQILRAE